jgi:hypothetical protein
MSGAMGTKFMKGWDDIFISCLELFFKFIPVLSLSLWWLHFAKWLFSLLIDST